MKQLMAVMAVVASIMWAGVVVAWDYNDNDLKGQSCIQDRIDALHSKTGSWNTASAGAITVAGLVTALEGKTGRWDKASSDAIAATNATAWLAAFYVEFTNATPPLTTNLVLEGVDGPTNRVVLNKWMRQISKTQL